MNHRLPPADAVHLHGPDEPRPPRQPDLERFVAADHPDRLLAPEVADGTVLFRVDRTHEQPLIVARQVAGRIRIVARFSDAGEAARLYSPDGKTLPAPIVRQLAGQP